MATKAGTEEYFQQRGGKRRLFDGISLSPLGFGTYLGAADDATDRLYEETLAQALLSGMNHIDTALTYRSMRSERLIRRALTQVQSMGISLDQIFISTKGGFLPNDGPPEKFEDFVRMHYLDTAILDPKDIVVGCHSMSPSFLESQIKESLKNLNVERIDLYYLHNPEIELPELGEELFYARCREAFSLFEKMILEKKIHRYGISSWNGFRQKKALPLDRLVSIAREVGGESHHFKAIQIPFNLVMSEALKVKNQKGKEGPLTLFEKAKELGISVFISSPLMQGQVIHLPKHVFEKLPKGPSIVVQALDFVLNTPGVLASYVGMKEKKHLEENLRVLKNLSQ